MKSVAPFCWTLLPALSLVPIVWAFAPGSMDTDSISYFSQAHDNVYNDWFGSFVVGVLHVLGGNAASLVFTLCLTLGAFAFFTYNIYRLAGLNHAPACLLTVVTCYTPPLLGPLTGHYRDTWTAVSFVGATYLSMLYHARPRLLILLARALLLAVAGLVRTEFLLIAGLFLLLDFLLITDRPILHRARDLALGAVVMIGAWVTIDATAFHLERAQPTHSVQVIYLFDLADLTVATNTVLIPHPFADNITLESMKRHYDPFDCYSCIWGLPANEMLKLSFNGSDVSLLRNQWLLAVFNHPVLYLEHRATEFGAYLKAMRLGYLPVMADNTYGLTVYHPACLAVFARYLQLFGSTGIQMHGVSLVGSPVVAVLLLACGPRTPVRAALLVALTCGFCYLLSWFILAAAPYYRYGHAGTVIFWIALYVSIADLVRSRWSWG